MPGQSPYRSRYKISPAPQEAPSHPMSAYKDKDNYNLPP